MGRLARAFRVKFARAQHFAVWQASAYNGLASIRLRYFCTGVGYIMGIWIRASASAFASQCQNLTPRLACASTRDIVILTMLASAKTLNRCESFCSCIWILGYANAQTQGRRIIAILIGVSVCGEAYASLPCKICLRAAFRRVAGIRLK